MCLAEAAFGSLHWMLEEGSVVVGRQKKAAMEHMDLEFLALAMHMKVAFEASIVVDKAIG